MAKTAGPYGNNVFLLNGRNARVTKDGITVLRSMTDPETESDFIALSVIRSASDETNRKAGDGTTATCILANEIFQQGYKFLTAGCNGNLLRNGILKASELAQKLVVDSLEWARLPLWTKGVSWGQWRWPDHAWARAAGPQGAAVTALRLAEQG